MPEQTLPLALLTLQEALELVQSWEKRFGGKPTATGVSSDEDLTAQVAAVSEAPYVYMSFGNPLGVP